MECLARFVGWNWCIDAIWDLKRTNDGDPWISAEQFDPPGEKGEWQRDDGGLWSEWFIKFLILNRLHLSDQNSEPDSGSSEIWIVFNIYWNTKL